MERSIPLEKEGFYVEKAERGWSSICRRISFLEKGHLAIGLALISETSKAACSTFLVVP